MTGITTLIASTDLEVKFQKYRVDLHRAGVAEVFAVKTRRAGGTYLSSISNGSATYKRVMKALRQNAQPGSLMAEQLAEFDR